MLALSPVHGSFVLFVASSECNVFLKIKAATRLPVYVLQWTEGVFSFHVLTFSLFPLLSPPPLCATKQPLTVTSLQSSRDRLTSF